MAKNAAAKKIRQHNAQRETAATTLPVTDLRLVTMKGLSYFDLELLMRQGCKVDGVILHDRKLYIDRFIRKLHKSLREGGSNETWLGRIYSLKAYLSHCDQQGVEAMAEEGYHSYYHQLWQRVREYDPYKPLWLYQENEEVGLKESAARKLLDRVKSALQISGSFKASWEAQLSTFSSQEEPYKAYSQRELNTTLDRLLSYFGQLTAAIVKTDSPEAAIEVQVDGEMFVISGKKRPKGHVDVHTPFNQAMCSAYYLLAFFTAFNSSPLLDICRPLQRISDKKSDRTEEWFELTAYKRRGKTDVRAVVGGEVTANDVAELKVARSGWGFLVLLQTLSEAYHPESDGVLLYLLDLNQQPVAMTLQNLKASKLSQTLHLTIDNRSGVATPLLLTFNQLLDCQSYDRIYVDSEAGRVRREKKSLQVWSKRVTPVAFALIDAIQLSNAPLKNIVLPITLEEDESLLIANFCYSDGTPGSLRLEASYRPFLERMIVYAESRNYGPKSKKPRYLLPLGGKGNTGTYQWQRLVPSLSTLSDYGIQSGDYLLNLSSSRFRQTAAGIARTKNNSTELHIALILQNSLSTIFTHYSDDNPDDNRRVMHQALMVIERLAKGQSLEQAKSLVAESLNMEVLTIDQLNARSARSNVAGTFCDGGKHPEQRKTARRAKKLKALDRDEQLACFQYDQCIECRHGKLVDDLNAIWRLLSFAECIDEAADRFPAQHQKNLGESVRRIHLAIAHNLSEPTISAAHHKLATQGRHPYWQSIENVIIC